MSSMAREDQAALLQIVFLPFPTPGHMIPMVDLAKTIASSHGTVKCTIITTPANAKLFEKSIASCGGEPITIKVLDFPASAVGLPNGVENYASVTSNDMGVKLFYALVMLQKPIQSLIKEISPACIISDMFYPWTSDFAKEIGCPRLVFQSSSVFALCCAYSVKVHSPHESVDSDEGTFTLPYLPDKIEMRKSQIPKWVLVPNIFTSFMEQIKEAELKSYGIVANTFYELEPGYVDYYKEATGVKMWTVGPVSLNVGDDEEAIKAERGRKGTIDWSACLEWLDQKKQGSVLFVTFGSLTKFPNQQLKEIAAGLEASGHDFLWVVRKKSENIINGVQTGDEEDWLPKGFKERMRETNKGFIIEDWAPQILILEHQAVGAMVTHCGWNSTTEGINAGLPLVTWPVFAEQFYNERFVVDVLQIGVAVGATTWCDVQDTENREVVKSDKLDTAVRLVMGTEEAAIGRRQRAKELSKAATRAIKDGGSSQAQLIEFINLLKAKRPEA